MTKRLLVMQKKNPLPPERQRRDVRDGWRVFRSSVDGFEVAIPAYQVTRVEILARLEKNEWHAIALGELYRDSMGIHCVIRDFVPNEWAERGRAHVHMSSDSEGRVRELGKALHPSLVAVGGIHTHPGYTTQPSGTDQKEFWSDRHAVSIIVDPSDSPTIAVYRGRDGEKLSEVEVVAAMESTLQSLVSKHSEARTAANPHPAIHPSWRTSLTFAVAAFVAGVIAVVASIGIVLQLRAMASEEIELAGRLEMVEGKMQHLGLANSQWFARESESLQCLKDGE